MRKKITTLALVAAAATLAVPGLASAETEKTCARSAVSEPVMVGNTVHAEGRWSIVTGPTDHVRFQIWKRVPGGSDEQVAVKQAPGNGVPFSADGPSRGHGAYYSTVDFPPYFPVQCRSDDAYL